MRTFGKTFGSLQIGTLLNLPPAILNDGNTVAWYDASDLTTITKDGSNKVSRWNDKLGSGNDLIQATGNSQPIWSNDGILFDGIDDVLKKQFSLVQPVSIYVVVTPVSPWVNNKSFFDGYNIYTGAVRTSVQPEQIKAYANAYSGAVPYNSQTVHFSLFDNKCILRTIFNSTNSRIRISGSKAITGDFGSASMNGLSVGGNGTDLAKCVVNEIIVRKLDETENNESIIYNYAKIKNNVKTIHFFGDSTLSYVSGNTWNAVRKYVTFNSLKTDSSYPGQTISAGLTEFNLHIDTYTDLDAVIIMIGINNLTSDISTLIQDYQGMINSVRTSIGVNKKIIICTMIPCSRASHSLFPTQAPKWDALNEAILGNGTTPITGVNERINTVNTALNAGDNTLAAAYDSGDALHENNAAREIIGGLIDAALLSLNT